MENAPAAAYKVCVYIKVAGGWWTKPFFDPPSVSIHSDGTWEASITTGGSDHKATEIVAYVTPLAYTPPPSAGAATLPRELEERQFPRAIADRRQAVRTLAFSGYEWEVKDLFWGPGPNYFSESIDNVWVDRDGQLHLKVTQRGGAWFCAEVISRQTFGYGEYVFQVSSRVDQLNEDVVLGLFTYDLTAPQARYGEIDVEFSRWGNPAAKMNSQYVIQPFDRPENLFRFNLALDEGGSTHRFDWRRDQIRFRSVRGQYAAPPPETSILQQWAFQGPDIPKPGSGNVRMNLWLFNGVPPSDGREVEVVIKAFSYIP